MTPESFGVVKDFVKFFEETYPAAPKEAAVYLLTAFTTCFGMLSPEDRIKCMQILVSITRDINTEIFEDGVDFASFLGERAEERRKECKGLEAQDDSSG